MKNLTVVLVSYFIVVRKWTNAWSNYISPTKPESGLRGWGIVMKHKYAH